MEAAGDDADLVLCFLLCLAIAYPPLSPFRLRNEDYAILHIGPIRLDHSAARPSIHSERVHMRAHSRTRTRTRM